MEQEIIIKNIKNEPRSKVTMSDKYAFENCAIAAPYMGNKCFVTAYSIPPGKSNFPYHYHAATEEIFYIISGTGVLETPKGDANVTDGDVIVMPAGSAGAHRLTNSSNDMPLVYLDVSAPAELDVVFYPHSNKLMAIANGIRKVYRIDSDVDYLDGE